MKFGLDADKKSVVEHARPWCAEVQNNSPKEYLKLATMKTLDDTEALIKSRGGN
jgi:hypothetical protein